MSRPLLLRAVIAICRAVALKCFVAVFMLAHVLSLSSQTTVIIGASNGANGTTTYPCPLGDYYTSQRAQYLYNQASLTAAGIPNGAIITQIGWVTNATTISNHLQEGYSLGLKNTNIAGIVATAWETGITSVYGPTNYSYVTGSSGNVLFNVTPFTYTGTGLLVEVCGGLTTSSGFTSNPACQWTTLVGYNASHTYRADYVNGCGNATTTNSGTLTTRPRLVITYTLPGACAGTPSAGTSTINLTSGCLPQGVSLNSSGATLGSGITYQWQSAPTAGGPWANIATGTTLNFNTTATATTFYRLIVTCTNSSQSATSGVVSYTGTNCFLMNGGNITACSGQILDSGGSGGPYQNLENQTVVITPGTPGNAVSLTFSSFNTEAGFDILRIYDGNSTNAVLIGSYSGTTLPPVITASNTTGALTLQFTSDGSVNNPGFQATISCVVPSCNTVTIPSSINANLTTTVVNNAVTFTVGGGNGSVIAYQWSFNNFVSVAGQVATTASPWTLIINSNVPQIWVRAITRNGVCPWAASAAVVINMICAPPITYTTSSSGDYVANVQFNTINNTSTYDANGDMYQDFTSITTTVCKGSQYNLSVTGPSAWSHCKLAWIDFNGDGDFSDAGEYLFTSPYSTAPFTQLITIPSTAITGNVKLRVLSVDNSAPSSDPCFTGGYLWGEVEEYTVNIQPNPVSPTASNVNACFGGNAVITASANAAWYDAPAGGNFLGNAAVLTTPALTAPPSVTYYMEGVANGCPAQARNSVIVNINPFPNSIPPVSANSTGCNIYAPNSTWTYFVDPFNQIISCVNSGVSLTSVNSSTNVLSSVPYQNGVPYIPRLTTITPGINGPAQVRLYYTLSEFQALQAVQPALTAHTDLGVTKFDNSNLTGNPMYIQPSNYLDPTQTGIPNVYALEFITPGFSTFAIHYNFGNSVLPVEFTATHAQCGSNGVLVEWSTATETQCSHYNVYRSNIGTNWQIVGTVAGSGTTSEPHSYSLTDWGAVNGTNYYKIEQVDFNGTANTAPLITTTCDNIKESSELIPNPATDLSMLIIHSVVETKCRLIIMDGFGRETEIRNESLSEGRNTLTLNWNNYSPGIYVIKVEYNGKQEEFKQVLLK